MLRMPMNFQLIADCVNSSIDVVFMLAIREMRFKCNTVEFIRDRKILLLKQFVRLSAFFS